MKLEWKDRTRYEDGSDIKSNDFLLTFAGLHIALNFISTAAGDLWRVSCPELGLANEAMPEATAQFVAEEMAISRVRIKLRLLAAATARFDQAFAGDSLNTAVKASMESCGERFTQDCLVNHIGQSCRMKTTIVDSAFAGEGFTVTVKATKKG